MPIFDDTYFCFKKIWWLILADPGIGFGADREMEFEANFGMGFWDFVVFRIAAGSFGSIGKHGVVPIGIIHLKIHGNTLCLMISQPTRKLGLRRFLGWVAYVK